MESITTKNILTKQYDGEYLKGALDALYWLLKEINEEGHCLAERCMHNEKNGEYLKGVMDAFNSVYVRILELTNMK
ncbi:hypothetical protein ES705_17154 [subsurface metagenome]